MNEWTDEWMYWMNIRKDRFMDKSAKKNLKR